jgi:hypothetical protein
VQRRRNRQREVYRQMILPILESHHSDHEGTLLRPAWPALAKQPRHISRGLQHNVLRNSVVRRENFTCAMAAGPVSHGVVDKHMEIRHAEVRRLKQIGTHR